MGAGHRSSKPREIVSAEVPALVSESVWYAAQETFGLNRIAVRNAGRAYLLKSVIECGVCGLTYCAALDDRINSPWYRCNGQLRRRSIIEGRCTSKAIKGPELETVVWADIESFLHDPGVIIEELAKERDMNPRAALTEVERPILEEGLKQISNERLEAYRLATKRQDLEPFLEEVLNEIDQRETTLTKRLGALTIPIEDEPETVDEDMLTQVRRRLDQGLTDEERQEIARLLVGRITIHTKGDKPGKKQATAVIEYRFPKSVVVTFTGTDSWHRPG
jgi:site-specific DNA recombinase